MIEYILNGGIIGYLIWLVIIIWAILESKNDQIDWGGVLIQLIIAFITGEAIGYLWFQFFTKH